MKGSTEIKAQAQTFERIIDISFDDERELQKLSEEAKKYLLRHNWCKSILDGWLAVYWEEILSVFLFKIDPMHPEVDNYVWIVVGDLPPAYIDVESGKIPKQVLESYVLIMDEWANNVMEGKTISESYPVEVPPTIKYATMLKNRLVILNSFIEEEFD